MIYKKTLHIETSESQYRVELDVDLNIEPPDYSCDNSDIDYYGTTALLGYEINSVEIRDGIENIPLARQKKDWLTYTWTEVQMGDLSPEEQQELNEQINKELSNECNC